MKSDKKFLESKLFWLGMCLLLVIVALFVWIFGRYQMSAQEVAHVIYKWIIQDPNLEKSEYLVVVMIRLPRILLAILVGMGLSVSGVAFQSVFSNPLTTPDLLGVTAGASFGAAIAILFDFNQTAIQIAALLFGVVAVALSYFLSTVSGKSSIIMLILSGIVVSSIFSALLSLIKFVADTDSKLPAITFWLMGSLSGASFKTLFYYAPMMIIGMAVIFLLRWKLNILSLSEEEATSLGIHLKTYRAILIVASTLIVASIVALCGTIGWVGLLIPHICRLLFGANTKYLVPSSMIIGAIFLLCVDTISRTMSVSEVPIGILCSLLGAPIFIALLRKSKEVF